MLDIFTDIWMKKWLCMYNDVFVKWLHHFIFFKKSKQLWFHMRTIAILTLEYGITITLCLFPWNQSKLYMMKWKYAVKPCRFTSCNAIYSMPLFIWNVLHMQLTIFTLKKKIKPLVILKGHLSNCCNKAQLVSQSLE